MKNQIQNNNKNEIARPNNEIAIEGLEGFTTDVVMKHVPYLNLIQGSDHPLRDKFEGIKDGDFVTAEGEKLGSEFEFILFKTAKVFIEKEVEVDRKTGELNPKAKTLRVLTYKEYNSLPATDLVERSGTMIVHKKPDGEILRVFQPKYIFLGFSGGKPYQLSFGSFMKMKSAEKMVAQLAIAKVFSTTKVVFKIFSEKQKSREGVGYYSISSQIVRESTEKDMKDISQFLGLDISFDEPEVD